MCATGFCDANNKHECKLKTTPTAAGVQKRWKTKQNEKLMNEISEEMAKVTQFHCLRLDVPKFPTHSAQRLAFVCERCVVFISVLWNTSRHSTIFIRIQWIFHLHWNDISKWKENCDFFFTLSVFTVFFFFHLRIANEIEIERFVQQANRCFVWNIVYSL